MSAVAFKGAADITGGSIENTPVSATTLTVSSTIDMGGQEITNAGAATAGSSATTRTYIEGSMYCYGFEDYNATDAALTPAADAKTQVLNNGLGAATNKIYKIPGRGDIWDTTNNEFDWQNAGLVTGDTVLIRMDFLVTTDNNNNGVVVELDLAIGSGNDYTLTIGSQDYRSAGTYNLVVVAEIYMGDTDTLDNPCRIFITSDSAGESIVYNGHYVKYSLRNPSAT